MVAVHQIPVSVVVEANQIIIHYLVLEVEKYFCFIRILQIDFIGMINCSQINYLIEMAINIDYFISASLHFQPLIFQIKTFERLARKTVVLWVHQNCF